MSYWVSLSMFVKDTNKLQVLNSLAKKLSKERAQQQKKKIKNDQPVQSFSHYGLPALWRTPLVNDEDMSGVFKDG